MLNIKKFYNKLLENGIDFFTGVPDSYLNNFCNYLNENCSEDKHVIAANEGNAISIASGHYMATKKVPLVYMQNSGMGNSLNPLVSLADNSVYNIPILLLIGWRGQPNSKDWPQHKLQGKITTKLLEDIGIGYGILSENEKHNISILNDAFKELQKNNRYAIISPNKVLNGGKTNIKSGQYSMSRRRAMKIILDTMSKDTIYCASTGRLTRELYWIREEEGESHKTDFLNVGSMGHASSVGLGIALANKDKNVVVLDGDAAAIMHLGALTMASKYKLPNFTHIILNNGVHESVGGQPSAGFNIDFTKIAKASGYNTLNSYITNEMELLDALNILSKIKGPKFIEVRILNGMEKNLPDLNISHKDLIDEFIDNLTK